MKSIGFARRKELREERLGTFVPGVHSGLVSIEPLLHSPQKREREQTEPDCILRYSPEYTPVSPSPPHHCMTGAKVGRGKVLIPPLDRTGMNLPPSSVRRHISPPPIRGPIEVHAYTDSDDDDEEEEEPNDVASLRECNTRFIKEHKPSNHIRARIKSHVYTTE